MKSSFIKGMIVGGTIAIISSLSSFYLARYQQDINNEYVYTVIEDSTNQNDRATQQNVNWFKDNSNYIWDGWKIK